MSAEAFVEQFAPHTLADITDWEFAGVMIRADRQPPFEEKEKNYEHEIDIETDSDGAKEDSEEEWKPIETLDRKAKVR
jgi:hypothetical protein